MKLYFLPLAFLIFGTSFGQEDFSILIDGKAMDIALDKEYQVTIRGKDVKFTVQAKDTLTYIGDLFSFKYSKDYKVTKSIIDDGIDQQMIMTADGTGVAVQQYTNFNPTLLNEIIMDEITKESISYGYESVRQDYDIRLLSGQQITVNKTVLTYKGETNIYEVASIGKKDEGIVIITMKMNDNPTSDGQKVIDLLWNTLEYK